MPSFLGGNLAVLFLAGNRMTTVAFEKEVLACLAKRFSSTEVKFENLRKTSYIYKWKEKVDSATTRTGPLGRKSITALIENKRSHHFFIS